ncbi:DUF2075 domain-containing protein [Marivirga arenosa]|uniref:DUF2075 domain-containing protein n=1 Tax=Marivirga arenosa TaxID=3059076 RepID=A0AA51ZVJ2_9BACT|nr:DUF2075 domain-containing protein [Marivirga sp. BKB1-2]WNB17521.1 DUF2075 domain-containing protein [Marivirga sp. BKB1-2]
MIVYKSTKKDFLVDVYDADIQDIVREAVEKKLFIKVGDSELNSWGNSIPQVEIILRDKDIPDDALVAIEYNIPRTQNRIDFIISGTGENGEDNVILIELKQWSKATLTEKDAIVTTRFAHGEKETVHPSYQAWSYSMLLRGYNAAVYEGKINLFPCAYLHNYNDDGIISNEFYKDHITNAPLFCKGDKRDFREFVKRFIKYGDKKDLILTIENGELRPSKKLASSLASLLKGNKEFTLIDTQKEVYETAKTCAIAAKNGHKKVLIVEGGPGTGKSVIAINLLVELTKKGLITQYVTKNSAPRAVYESKLTGTIKKTQFSNLFSGSGSYSSAKPNSYDALIVDEAHRLNEKSGLYSNLGENQIKEIISSSVFSIFFIDEKQKIHIKDIGSIEQIKAWAELEDAEVQVMELTSQFRCEGSDGYLSWLNNSLQIKTTANRILNAKEYDFRVYDNPNELRDEIFKLNKVDNSARLLAGYCWDWNSKKDPDLMDIVIPEHNFEMQWNLNKNVMLWMIKPDSVSEIGCIHTSQGLEADYVGVIIGPDLIVRNGKIITNAFERSGMDHSIRGFKKLHKADPKSTNLLMDQIIKNTYYTLMTRAMRGCFIYCTDEETSDYFKNLIEH